MKHAHLDSAGDTTLVDAGVVARLRRVVVNSGASGATVTIKDGAGSEVAVIDAANPDVGREYTGVQTSGLVVTVAGTPDVTVVYSADSVIS